MIAGLGTERTVVYRAMIKVCPAAALVMTAVERRRGTPKGARKGRLPAEPYRIAIISYGALHCSISNGVCHLSMDIMPPMRHAGSDQAGR
jgi:hypothetical protein